MFLYIVLPQLKSSMRTAELFLLLRISQIYREAYLLGGNYPPEGMYLLPHIFHNWFRDYKLDKLSAGACVYILGIIMILFLLERGSNDERKS